MKRAWILSLLLMLSLLLLLTLPGGPVDAGQGARPSEHAQLTAATIQNRDAQMVRIEGAMSRLGTDDGLLSEGPSSEVEIATFWMDKTEVTRAQFRAFIGSTGYTTDAERLGGAVIDPRTHTWRIDLRATWRTPFGDAAAPPPEDHPVSQVSWRDAYAFCQAYGLRLPTEAEWEHAARLGQAPGGVVFMFGSQPLREGEYLANFWQGLFPVLNTVQDGYRYTAPVGRFGVAPSGLTDMAGNVWEWTDDWYRPYATRDQRFTPDQTSERVQRGGSFLCDPNMCQGYRVTARGHATPDSAHMHVGFRCASSASPDHSPQRAETHSTGDL